MQRERERGRVCVCVCVCVWEREREREREREWSNLAIYIQRNFRSMLPYVLFCKVGLWELFEKTPTRTKTKNLIKGIIFTPTSVMNIPPLHGENGKILCHCKIDSWLDSRVDCYDTKTALLDPDDALLQFFGLKLFLSIKWVIFPPTVCSNYCHLMLCLHLREAYRIIARKSTVIIYHYHPPSYASLIFTVKISILFKMGCNDPLQQAQKG